MQPRAEDPRITCQQRAQLRHDGEHRRVAVLAQFFLDHRHRILQLVKQVGLHGNVVQAHRTCLLGNAQGPQQGVFQGIVEHEYADFIAAPADTRHNVAAQGIAHVGCQQHRVLGGLAAFDQRRGYGDDVAHRDVLNQQLAVHPVLLGIRQLASEVFGQLGRQFGQALHQAVDVIMFEDVRQVVANHLVQMRGDHPRAVHHLVAQVQGAALFGGVDPHHRHLVGRVDAKNTVHFAVQVGRRNGHQVVGMDFGALDLLAVDVDAVVRRLESQAVTDLDLGQEKAQVLREGLAQAAHALGQGGARGLIDQTHQFVAQ